MAEMDAFPFLPDRVGSFWSRQAQVDVLAINWRTKDILLGECKWGQKPVGRELIQALINKTDKVLPGSASWQVHYAFFARQGFTEAAQALAAEHNSLLVTLTQIEADMERWLTGQRREAG